MKYEVVIWRDTLSDGSVCYAAICPSLRLAHGQGDTEGEALAEIAEALACFLEREPDKLKTGQAARDAMTSLIVELTTEGVDPWVRRVVPASVPVTA